MDLTFPIRWVIPEKDLIDWGQNTALRQNINFSNSNVFASADASMLKQEAHIRE